MVRQFRVSRAIERFRVNEVLDPIFWPVENSSWAVLLNEAEVYFHPEAKGFDTFGSTTEFCMNR